jgi:RNA polymerase sigma-70 factor (ECF subfamily)
MSPATPKALAVLPMESIPEVDLVRRAVAGCENAFAELFDRFSRPVLLFLAARLPSRDEAEDAVQATFLAAWSALPRLRRPERFAPWLFRIARNKARDAARRRELRPVPIRVDDPAPVAPEELREADRIHRLLGKLRPETRTLVLLRAVEGWSAEEVGRALGLSASTVRRRYARSLEHLRRALTEGREA